MKKILASIFLTLYGILCMAQAPDDSQTGAWYMYFFNKRFDGSRFGIQGDYQFRFWNVGTDLEQLLLRTGVTYRPKNADILFTFGYAHITSGTFGESNNTVTESRLYQEALFPQKIGSRFLLTHRMRYEQRWVEDQDFRTRFRYNLFVNVPLNKTQLAKNTIYLAFYNEIFINGERRISPNQTVDYFDRNRFYTGIGYGLRDNFRVQGGWMEQTTANWSKGQLQISLHHNF